MSGIALRAMLASDADTIAALHATSWLSAYRGILPDAYLDDDLAGERQAVWRERLQGSPDPRAFGVIADDDTGRRVGFAYVVRRHDPVWGSFVDNLHVLPDVKGGGIGRGLLAEVARQLGPNHAQPLYLWVLDANAPAKRFYARLGAEFAEQETETLPFGDAVLAKWRCVWRDPTTLLSHA
jgi:GNAT superfamily N-acetyltransferase